MTRKIIITVPKLSTAGGVSAFWNALLPKLAQYEDIAINTLEVGGHGKNILGPVSDQMKFKKTIDSTTDLVVLNPSLGARSFFRDGLFARRLAKKNVDFVVFFHGWDLAFEEKVSKKYVKFFQNSFGKAKRIFVLSQEFKSSVEEWGFEGEVFVETTTVDSTLLNDFSIEEKLTASTETAHINILFLSRLLREKGIYEVIDAFKNLQTRFSNLRLIIAGDGVEFKTVSHYIRSLSGIEMKGHVEGECKVDLFKECHIYCMPSYSEGLPTSVLEAMAFALPVVTTPVGGLKYFFEDKKMGYFVDLEKREDLEQKLEKLIVDGKLRAQIGKYNHDVAAERLVSTVVAKRLHNHFLHCMSAPLNS